jgi:hypothetical protein
MIRKRKKSQQRRKEEGRKIHTIFFFLPLKRETNDKTLVDSSPMMKIEQFVVISITLKKHFDLWDLIFF